MKSENVEVQGTRVIINTSSEATAREMAVRADRDRIGLEGKLEEKLDVWSDKLGAVVKRFGRPAFGIFGWAAAIIGGALAFNSFDRLWPQLSPGFGSLGVLVVLGGKEAIARLAEARNLLEDPVVMGDKTRIEKIQARADLYVRLAIIALVAIVGSGTFYQVAVSDDQASGVTDIEKKVDQMQREIREATYRAEQMKHPEDDVDTLKQDILRARSRQAQNRVGDDAGVTVGKSVSAGDVVGEEPAGYCVTTKTNAYYVDRYCKDLSDLDKTLRQRAAYDGAVKAIVDKQGEVDKLEKSKPKKASSAAAGEKVAQGKVAWLGFVLSAFMLLIVDGFMMVCTFVSKRHPKGVED